MTAAKGQQRSPPFDLPHLVSEAYCLSWWNLRCSLFSACTCRQVLGQDTEICWPFLGKSGFPNLENSWAFLLVATWLAMMSKQGQLGLIVIYHIECQVSPAPELCGVGQHCSCSSLVPCYNQRAHNNVQEIPCFQHKVSKKTSIKCAFLPECHQHWTRRLKMQSKSVQKTKFVIEYFYCDQVL